MPGPESELPGFQSNPNDFGKCSSCGVILTSKQEAKATLCKDCQERHKDREDVMGKSKK
ncbi:hypothetical protein GCM10010954_19850 [Halobacillus andaensis]|uniref:Uncharacterized protein n=1 Tax=Halobacillus andaensis TaxID=1176239 RepID=A0A917EWA3_HALAA|nr:hypothetical protein [Halobacillus andaensis]MBP2004510.1 RNA polymerase-binding transcription factor DksA [Halobacillus andaensis]GGF21107.1 hypothetical protein GCM10010954_19850 [Halobacillus andaensis]